MDYLKVVHYWYEDRTRAGKFYIKLGKRAGAIIRQLGYPRKNSLKSWHWAFEHGEDFPVGYVRSWQKYSDEQKRVAVEHYLNHDRCIAGMHKSTRISMLGRVRGLVR